ncbi:MAG: PKD domain-containing protein, partial [Deltaproteobacteria bacterium]
MFRSLRISTVLALALGACAHRNQPPKAAPKAAAPSAVVGSVVQLDGSASSDPQSLPLSFHWEFISLPSGSHAALNNPAIVNPSFVADAAGSFVAQLVVSDGILSSSPANVTVNAGPCGAQPPTVSILATPQAALGVIGGDGGADTGALIQLSATIADPNAAPPCSLVETFSYAWSFQSLPPGSHAQLNAPQASDPSFVADIPGQYLVSLSVTDSSGLTGTATQTLTVGSCGNNPPIITGVSAVPAQPAIGDVVQLAARVSQPDNQPPCNAN